VTQLPLFPAGEEGAPAPSDPRAWSSTTPAPRVLILMACSKTKLEHAHQARHLYNGPMWQTLRQVIGSNARAWRDVFVLSARYGLIAAETHIAPYNQQMDGPELDRIIAAGIHGMNRAGPSVCDTLRPEAYRDRPPFERVIIGAASHYVRAIRTWIPPLKGAGIIAREAELRWTAGGIGEQRAQLARFVREWQT
jgi:hypothetical protein